MAADAALRAEANRLRVYDNVTRDISNIPQKVISQLCFQFIFTMFIFVEIYFHELGLS